MHRSRHGQHRDRRRSTAMRSTAVRVLRRSIVLAPNMQAVRSAAPDGARNARGWPALFPGRVRGFPGRPLRDRATRRDRLRPRSRNHALIGSSIVSAVSRCHAHNPTVTINEAAWSKGEKSNAPLCHLTQRDFRAHQSAQPKYARCHPVSDSAVD